jgi:hypothetical protein
MRRLMVKVSVSKLLGVYYYSEEEKYDGEWKNNSKCGKGNFTKIVRCLLLS